MMVDPEVRYGERRFRLIVLRNSGLSDWAISTAVAKKGKMNAGLTNQIVLTILSR